MSVNACYDYIIGFSRKEDVCVRGWDSAYDVSDSGLFVDELPGMPQRFIDALGGNYDIWEKYEYARENAINAFKLDVLGAILQYKEPSRPRYRGDIGYKSFTQTLSGGTYNGMRMYSDIRGGQYVLRGVYLILNVTENVTLHIYDEYDLLYSRVVNAVAGKPTYTALNPITLPLGGNYYFIFETTGQVYNNKLCCNCGGYKWCFNEYDPCYRRSRDIWTEWAMIAGVYGDDLTEREDWTISRNCRGLILFGDFSCDVLSTLCNDYSDFANNEVDLAIAHAVWYKTGEYLATYVMDSEEVSRKTLLGVEQWNNNRAFYNARYTAMIDFIAENIEEERNECLKCKDAFGYKRMRQNL